MLPATDKPSRDSFPAQLKGCLSVPGAQGQLLTQEPSAGWGGLAKGVASRRGLAPWASLEHAGRSSSFTRRDRVGPAQSALRCSPHTKCCCVTAQLGTG